MRVISWFSCGAASAVATVIARVCYPETQAVYCHVKEESKDNERFLDVFSRVMHTPVKTIINDTYEGSIYNVFRKRGYIKHVKGGAPCTLLLKKELRKSYQKPTDLQVFGYTVEEQDRADRFIDANNDVKEWFPLIEAGLTKQNCLDIVSSWGIDLPIMYKLGYNNNNCIGCVKGGMGYWNKIRKDFPSAFDEMALLEREIGHSVCKDKNGSVYLDELNPRRGRFKTDAPTDCGFTCEKEQ